MKTIKILVSGIVQGIFFRKFIENEAKRLKLNGFVRNLDDGRVEIVIEGKEEALINEMINLTKKGPKHSKIDNIEYKEINHQGFEDFKILNF